MRVFTNRSVYLLEYVCTSFQRCIPAFENAAFQVQIDSTNTCGEEEEQTFCVQTGYSNRKSCDRCRLVDYSPAVFVCELIITSGISLTNLCVGMAIIAHRF